MLHIFLFSLVAVLRSFPLFYFEFLSFVARNIFKIFAVTRGADRVGMLGWPATAATAASMDSRTRGPLEGGRR